MFQVGLSCLCSTATARFDLALPLRIALLTSISAPNYYHSAFRLPTSGSKHTTRAPSLALTPAAEEAWATSASVQDSADQLASEEEASPPSAAEEGSPSLVLGIVRG